ncbi:FAD binding domain-containing protein [Egicoccus halophilus]|uniref:FAD-binding PCMH-type domain-containing protein n=1 Tax=Egicoccus halophilus TaxID=1670830 RepID=A0A8J3ESV5_9ACTN|nr:FAD binding domain-containing protein [Egicoccus halophilus]GGI02368.1 hypothetical protein GCM10011354_00120 [Egicoccus halophilus]
MPLTFHHPTSLMAACELLAELDDAHLIAGGVSLSLMVREGFVETDHLVGLGRVDGLGEMARVDGALVLGARVTHDRLAHSESVREVIGCAPRVFGGIGNSRVRNAGTLGGNLAHADPAQDPPLLLAAARAVAEVRSVRGTRDVAVAELATGVFETALEADEVIARVRVPVPATSRRFGYCKLTPNSHDDYGTANAAVALESTPDGSGWSLRIVVGAVVATPFVLDVPDVDVDSLEAGLPSAVTEALATIRPQHDRKGTPAYKAALAQVAVRRAVDAALRDDASAGPRSSA